MVSFGCFKVREIFESIQKSNNELKKKLRKMSMTDDTFHKLKVAEDINKSNQPLKRLSSGENIRIAGSPALWKRTAVESFDPNRGREYDEYSSLNDADFWVRVSKERAEFKENNLDKTIAFNQGVYKKNKSGNTLKVCKAYEVGPVKRTLYSPGHPERGRTPSPKTVVGVSK